MESAKRIANKVNLVFLVVVLGGVQPFFPQSQISFRQLSVKEGLSQNSAISITQDSIGYLWIATQDGLNKYDGRKFSIYPYTFLDITKPDYSNLGKVYNDRQGGLWIIPSDKVPRKFDPKNQKFEPMPLIDDASIIYQGRDLNVYIGTYSEGLYVLRPDTIEPEQVLPFSVVGGTIYNIAKNSAGTVVLATDHQLLEYVSKTKRITSIGQKTNYCLLYTSPSPRDGLLSRMP